MPGFDERTSAAIVRLSGVLAEALADTGLQRVVWSSLRSSPYAEYKTDLAQFLGSPEAAGVRAAVRRLLAADADSLLASLPPLDFYMPVRAHRQRWLPGMTLGVVALFDEGSDLAIALPGDRRVPLDRRSRVVPDVAFVLLGPSELKVAVRARPQASGAFIEDDGGTGPEPGIANSECIVECGEYSGGGGGGGDNSQLRIDTLVTYGVIDNGFPWESNEFELRAVAAGVGAHSPVWRCTGIGSSEVVTVVLRCPSTVVHHASPDETSYVDVEVIETDGWPNPDDAFVNLLNNPNPNSFVPRVVDQPSNRTAYLLWAWPLSSAECPPNSPVTACPIKMEVLFKW